MFGYVRPFRPELKCRDFDLYRATYCGLCRCLRRRYGLLAPMFLNYDFTFLTLLLWQPEEGFRPCRGRCHANPLLKKDMCPDSPALELAADESMILTYWKLRDAAEDEGFWRGLPARLLSRLLGRAYRKAARRRPGFDRAVRGSLEELAALEREGCPSLDRTADTFARLLAAAAPAEGEEPRRRALEQLLYHVGRWIYLVDAWDDLPEDRRTGAYNPIAARFPGAEEASRDELRTTLRHSLNLARSAAALLELGHWRETVENILFLGLPLVEELVFTGRWKAVNHQNRRTST